jgi:cytoskeletal protein RodZ
MLKYEYEPLARATGISVNNIRNIEMERFDQLPPPAYVKVMVMALAKELGLDPAKAAQDYIKTIGKG